MARISLEEIFDGDDRFGLLNVAPARSRTDAPDARDREVVEQANAFFDRHGRRPAVDADDINENILARKLGVVARNENTQELAEIDRHSLIEAEMTPSAPEKSWRDDDDVGPASFDDILDEVDLDDALITPRNVTPASQREQPEHRGERRPCRDFAIFKPLFDDLHRAVERGDRDLQPFTKKGGTETVAGDFFVQKGLYAYVAEKAEQTVKGGRRDHRLRVIFSNATESDVLMRSFEKALYDDPTARRVTRLGFGPLHPDWDGDAAHVTGHVYVARSNSTQPDIARDRLILHKIGVTSGSVQRRVADAKNDPTFLFAPVEIVAVFELHGVRRERVEHILHTFFGSARADIEVPDRFGKRVRPREWFYVRPELVAQAVEAIKKGTITDLRYDVRQQVIDSR